MRTVAITIQWIISFLLIALTPSGVVVGQEAILDAFGNPVKSNQLYTIRTDQGRNVASTTLTLKICPQVMEASSSPFAIYERFSFVSSSDVIRLTTKFNVKFDLGDPCGGSGLWSAALYQPVFLNGSESSVESTFSFQKSRLFYYKFVSGSGDLQGDIGISVTQTRQRLLELKRYSAPMSVTFYPVN